MLNNYQISVGKSRKQNNNSHFPYLTYSIERMSYETLSNFITPKLIISIQCGEELKNYNKVQENIELTSSFVNSNNHTNYKYSTLNITNVNNETNEIQGYVENRVQLLLRRLYIDLDDLLVIGFNEEHCFNGFEDEIKVFIDYNDNKIELNCLYLDDYTLTCKSYDKSILTDVNVKNVRSIYREDWLVNAQSMNFYLLEPSETINIPLVQTFGISVNDFNDFTKTTIQSLIPKFRDTEKDLYVPVTKIDDVEYKSVTDYYFNLHFLQRYGDTWKLKDNALWNGVKDDFTFDKDFFDKNDNVTEYDHISDLVGFLGFTNNEVKYSKSSLKKSFLRLSYYDSEDLESANLLGYYTVFLNSSDLLNKYNRNKAKTWYEDYNIDKNEFYRILGITTTGFPVKTHDSQDNSSRLDMRIHIDGKIRSNQSTEGLNLFLHKQFNKDLSEKTVYLRIDFNHAKYGRTIPLMLPYHYKTNDVNLQGRFKSFKEIAEDQKNGGYGLKDFIKFYNIKLKIKNDFDNNRYIYWLDRSTYKFDNPDDTSSVTFNLYEAKMVNTNKNIDVDTDLISTVSNYQLTYKQSIVDKDDDILVFSPKVSYRLTQTTNTTNKKISDKSVVSRESKFKVIVNTGNLQVYEDYDRFKDVAPLGVQVVLISKTIDYDIYRIVTRQTEDNYDINASILVSNKSGKIQVERYKDYNRIIGSQNNMTLATVQSKDIIDGQVLLSEELRIELRRD